MQFILTFLLSMMPGDTLQFTLDQAIEYALVNNPEIEHLRLGSAKSEAQLGQARSAFYPSISATGGYAYLTDIPVFEIDSMPIPMGQSENYNFQVSLHQVLFAWGKIHNAYKMADIGKHIAKLTLDRKLQEIRYSVADAFYGLLVLEEMVKLSHESLAQLKRHATAVEKRYKAGLVPQFELLRAQVQIANLRPQVIQVEHGLKLAREGFKMVLGLDLDSEFKVIGELEMIDEEFDLARLTRHALENRIELKNLQYAEQILSLSKIIARRANLPTVIGGATYERKKPFSFTGDEWGSSMIFNIGFQWTIFSGFKNLYQYREATIQEQEARLALDNLKKAITLEVKQAHFNFLAAKEVLATVQENVEQAEKAFEIMDTRYKNGLATNLEFIDAQLASMQAQTNYLSALKDYYTSKAEIHKAVAKEE